MKKVLKYSILAASMLALFGCKNNNENSMVSLNALNEIYGDQLTLPNREDYKEYDFPDYSKETHFNNVEQFANMQGYMGWYYCYGSVDENELNYMTFEPFSAKYRSTSELEAYIQRDEWQPSFEHEIMCAFKCPRDGNIDVKIDVTLIYSQATGDDGVSLYCLTSTNSEEVFASAGLVESQSHKEIEETISAHKNEVLYFILSCNESRWDDLTRIYIDLTYGG